LQKERGNESYFFLGVVGGGSKRGIPMEASAIRGDDMEALLGKSLQERR